MEALQRVDGKYGAEARLHELSKIEEEISE
jgi:hypothetical protein